MRWRGHGPARCLLVPAADTDASGRRCLSTRPAGSTPPSRLSRDRDDSGVRQNGVTKGVTGLLDGRPELVHVPDMRWFSQQQAKSDDDNPDGEADDRAATSGSPAPAPGAAAGPAGGGHNDDKHDEVDTSTEPASVEASGMFGLPKGMVRSVSILTGSQFIITAGFGVIIPILPMLSAKFALGASGIGLLIAAPSAMRVLLNMPMGALSDKIGRRPLMVAGTLASGLGGIGTGLATSLMTMLPFRALVGAGSAASMAGSSAYMADLTAKVPQHRAKLLGVQQTVIMCSFVAGPAIGGSLATIWGPQMAFVLVGSLAGLCSLGYSMLPETLANKQPLFGPKKSDEDTGSSGDGSTTNATGSATGEGKASKGGWMSLLRDRNQQAIISMNSTMFLIYGAELTVVPLHAHLIWDATPAQIGVMFSIVSALGLLGAPLGGWLADKVGRKMAIIPPALMASGGLAALAFAHSHDTFLACMAVIGLGTSMMSPGLSAFAADVAPPDQRGQALSVGRQAGDITFAIAPMGMGLLADWASNGSALIAATSMALVGTGMFAWRARPNRVPVAPGADLEVAESPRTDKVDVTAAKAVDTTSTESADGAAGHDEGAREGPHGRCLETEHKKRHLSRHPHLKDEPTSASKE